MTTPTSVHIPDLASEPRKLRSVVVAGSLGGQTYSGAHNGENELRWVAALCIGVLCAVPFSLRVSPGRVSVSLDRAAAEIGRPLTPMSIAGVNRRSVNRRAYYRSAAYQSSNYHETEYGTSQPSNTYDSAYAANPPSNAYPPGYGTYQMSSAYQPGYGTYQQGDYYAPDYGTYQPGYGTYQTSGAYPPSYGTYQQGDNYAPDYGTYQPGYAAYYRPIRPLFAYQPYFRRGYRY